MSDAEKDMSTKVVELANQVLCFDSLPWQDLWISFATNRETHASMRRISRSPTTERVDETP